jgi:hypothetical protein
MGGEGGGGGGAPSPQGPVLCVNASKNTCPCSAWARSAAKTH